MTRRHPQRQLLEPLETRTLLAANPFFAAAANPFMTAALFNHGGFNIGGSNGFSVGSTSGFSVAGSNFSVAQTGNDFLFNPFLNPIGEGVTPVIPSATLIAPQLTVNGSVNFFLKIRFTGNAINTRSVASNSAIVVTGPHNFVEFATFVRSTAANNGTIRDVTYAVRRGAWNAPDVGTYAITLLPHKIADINGTFVPTTNLGTFRSTTPPIDLDLPT